MEDDRHPWMRIPEPSKAYPADGSASYFVRPGCGFRGASADRIGIWRQWNTNLRGTTAGIYLYSRASGVRKISDSEYVPVGSFG
jgi:hypothetical protein